MEPKQSPPLTRSRIRCSPQVSGENFADDSSMFQIANFKRRRGSLSDDATSTVNSSWSCASMFQPANFSLGPASQVPTDASHSFLYFDRKTSMSMGASTSSLLTAKLKERVRTRCMTLSEGHDDKTKTSLEYIYTKLHILHALPDRMDLESMAHEFSYTRLRRQPLYEVAVNACDMFKPLLGQEKPTRVVLTKGIAGIGKSITVQKFLLDWAQDKDHHRYDMVLCLSFRELNLCTGKKSFHQLLREFYPEICGLEEEIHNKANLMVILDGLDESRRELDFQSNKRVSSVSEVATVAELLSSLIQGSLLPSAHLWITSRPAAASLIPARLVDMMTEIRGYTDPQKEEYFRKRFAHNPDLADSIIKHTQSSPSLSIMCQIPIFCWVTAVLLQETFQGNETDTIPQTLTEMLAHFLFARTKIQNRKYGKRNPLVRREFLLKLGRLAFVHLLKNNLIFYEDDLEECDINVKDASIYSGFCSAILVEEEIFFHRKVFSFVHLTIQEFFAALYVFDCFMNDASDEPQVQSLLGLEPPQTEHTLLDLLKMTIDKVLENRSGHLDFFLRFLLGLMDESNRRPLQRLIPSPDPGQETKKKILTYLKAIRRKTVSPDRCVNVFQAMVEMRDHKVKDEIKDYLTSGEQSETELTPMHCSALAYMLQVSKSDLDEFILKSYKTSDAGRMRLIPAVTCSRKAILADLPLTAEWVEHLASALRHPYSRLKELDLSNTNLQDSGVELLRAGLGSPSCRLEILRLSGCCITEIGCASLAAALTSNPDHLRELDLSYNNPGESGVRQLIQKRDDPACRLSVLSVEHGGSVRMLQGLKKFAFNLTLNPWRLHRNIVVSEMGRKVMWVDEEESDDDSWEVVTCSESLFGRSYWEVEVCKPLVVGVMYESGRRAAQTLRSSDSSWSLVCSDEGCYVWNGSSNINVSSLGNRSLRLGVFLDHAAGTLSFYRVTSNTPFHIHTITTKFSRPVCAAFELRSGSSAFLC